MEFIELTTENSQIEEMSAMATEIVRQHFDPIIGTAQNDYMISLFQTPDAIEKQLRSGYRYYFVRENGENLGFLAFYPRGEAMYLSKFYLYAHHRGRGHAHEMLQFVVQRCKAEGLGSIELNVNRENDAIYAYEKMGFTILRQEKNDIGHGFFMDDYVYCLKIDTSNEMRL